jgi:hypothetical protein
MLLTKHHLCARNSDAWWRVLSGSEVDSKFELMDCQGTRLEVTPTPLNRADEMIEWMRQDLVSDGMKYGDSAL